MNKPRHNLIDLTGQKFNRWVVLERHQKDPGITGESRWLSRCECGTTKVLASSSLRKNTSKSCGCLKVEKIAASKLTLDEKKRRRAARAKIKDQEPDRRLQKIEAQARYNKSPKSALADFKRWLSKKKKTTDITDEEYLELRERPCEDCSKPCAKTAVCFILIKPRRQATKDNIKILCGGCKLAKPKEMFSINDYAVKTLRRNWAHAPMARLALLAAKVAPGRWQCVDCKNIFKRKEIQIDHINPVVDPIIGFVDINTFAARLLCDESNLQILCRPCHNSKTAQENTVRFNKKTLAESKLRRELKKRRTSK